ncbi:MAG: helix-turn-helix transcriptional regulator [Erysipelotrichaceae bacterium]|nr:helix-turn-helix transcriptional regulator [Erysipelotrichaceae bacterium]
MNFRLPIINMELTGQRINELRMANGMTVRDLQAVFGFSTPQAIYKWQRGVSMPTIDNLIVLCAIWDTQVEDILVIEND